MNLQAQRSGKHHGILLERGRRLMRVLFLYSGVLLSLLPFGYGCYQQAVNAPNTFSEPRTRLFVDSIGVVLSSQVTLRWFGDVPDGFVGGFFVSFDRTTWRFTTRQDSAFSLRFFTTDTSFTFSVAAARRDGGNGRYDTALMRGPFNFGPEPFTDVNRNGRWDEGEPFIDIGQVDTSPPSLRFPVRNSAPDIEFISLTPDTTLPVTQFEFRVSDPDGVETLTRLELALNDSTFSQNTVSVPVNNNSVLQITLSALAPRQAGVTEAQVFSGNNPVPLSTPLRNWTIGGQNVLYARVFDVAGSSSKRVVGLDSGQTWWTLPITSSMIIIDDFGQQSLDPLNAPDTTEAAIRMILGRLRGGKYTGANRPQVLDIRAGGTSDLGRRATLYSRPFVLSRLLLNYTVVLWLADGLPNLELAAFSLPEILRQGKHVMFNTGFSATPTIVDFSGAASVFPLALANLTNNMTLAPTSGFSDYPTLRYNGILRFSAYRAGTQALQVGGESIYELPADRRTNVPANSITLVSRRIYRSPGGEPLGRIIFATAALYRVANLAGNLDELYEKIFRDEFGE